MKTPYLIQRIQDIHQARGLQGTVSFLLSRIARVTRDVVFEIDLNQCVPKPEFSPGTEPLSVDASNCGDPDLVPVISEITRGEAGAFYRDGLSKGDLLFCVLGEPGEVLHYSFIQFESRYKRILGEKTETPLFTNCWTSPKARGKRLYPNTLRFGCEDLKRRGYPRAIITCDPSNTPSVRGIERAGFNVTGQITSLVFFSRIAVQKSAVSGDKARWRMCRL